MIADHQITVRIGEDGLSVEALYGETGFAERGPDDGGDNVFENASGALMDVLEQLGYVNA